MNDLPHFALSIRQPHAYAIMHLGKDIENRNWKARTELPLDICIHASLGMKREDMSDAFEFIDKAAPLGSPREHLRRQNKILTDARFGGIVAVATITEIVTEDDSPWFQGRYGYRLANVSPVKFIPLVGALGFFNWRANLGRTSGSSPLLTPIQQAD
ncbi:hypothetical protein [Asticcacaulis endophyticus]|uniref:ASCH domain-containing protein n=1 Tax=Asticcacaulis endophyticus TaxID=1395890 RepID=A0A918Q3L2_9CAUL|nr:hypothetical protein [Asticcacaulis endophyticus]GGZ31810.1 hypothetical protein GCM10011273_17250 [Asticcacaulis endophyticus]